MEYIGWIPCVGGHLDFGLMSIGPQGGFPNKTSKDKNPIEVNFPHSGIHDSHDRRIVLQSKVDWRYSEDYPKGSGNFRVVVTAEVNASTSMDNKYLEGDILIYPICAEPELTVGHHMMNIHSLCHSISINYDDGDYDEMNKDFESLKEITSGKKPVDFLSYFFSNLSFRIEPNGIVWLKIKKCSSNDINTYYILARQAFYFLSYSLHARKHYFSYQNSLTTITPTYDKTQQDLSEAGLRLICQFKRELTTIKQFLHLDEKIHQTNNSLGIIAYTKSLIRSLEDLKIIDRALAKREQGRFDTLNLSISSQNNQIINKINNLELVKSKAKIWLGLFLFSLWAIINFIFKNFSSDSSAESSLQLIDFGISVFVLIAFAYFVYVKVQQYYDEGDTPYDAVILYETKYLTIFNRILIALTALILLLVISYSTLKISGSKLEFNQMSEFILNIFRDVIGI